MRLGDIAGAVVRPAVSGTLRAHQTRKRRDTVTVQQWLGYIAVAVVTTWLTRTLDDLVERRLGPGPG